MSLLLKRVLGGSVLLLSLSNLAFASGFHSLNGGTTGGEGGAVVRATTGTEIHQAICQREANDTPLIIHVEGVINHQNTSKVSGSCSTANDKIELKNISNISLIGVGEGALFDELGIHIKNSSNIIIQNVHVRNVKKSGFPLSNGGDAIGMETNVSNVWVDHVTLEASGGEDDGFDALFDMKRNTKYVTLSYSILRNSGRGGLVGNSAKDNQNGPVTFHHNLYENIDSRTPLFRGRLAHVYNNYYKSLNKSGINARVESKIKVEHNYFGKTKNPLGTFYADQIGYWQVNGNIFSDQVTWSEPSEKFKPAGSNPVSTADITIPYEYQLDDASCIRDIVAKMAGANRGLLVSDGQCPNRN
ncbi:polysaccharide lyase family 1 protein [Neiella sp. HB171785]|uniref:Polysaccharide lyase family 1 protein n=1 Tax=Neiella litorisoli TaxID=2771431 RepID=A0A8J6UIS8_9GAMM|nr:polysaccharide lyase family 1 protein [Neiella litorisoli]